MFLPSSRSAGWPRAVAAAVALALALPWAAPLGAATRAAPVAEPAGRGEPMEQRFLSDGVSVVTTPRGPSCVASARLDIADSRYVAEDGTAVPFERIRRSPATSIQAIAGPDGASGGAPAFRVQLKFSPRPGAPLTLTLGEGGRAIDLRPALEPDTDSVLIRDGDAEALAAAFRDGAAVALDAISRDTGHRVTDALPAPDLDGLAACAARLDPAARPGPLAGRVAFRFEASATPETLATPDRLKACGMAPTDRPLHVGRLTSTRGVFAQVDTVFVAFDEGGRVVRAYVPGIIDADLTDPEAGTVQVSQAADSNLPDAVNAVTGCIGAHAVAACLRPDGAGAFAVEACGTFDEGVDTGPGAALVAAGPGSPGAPGGSRGPAGTASPTRPPLQLAGGSPVPSSPPGVLPPPNPGPNLGPSPGPGGGHGSPPPHGPGRPDTPPPHVHPPTPQEPPEEPPGPPDVPDQPEPPPPVVPVPATALLLLTGLLGLGLVRRRA